MSSKEEDRITELEVKIAELVHKSEKDDLYFDFLLERLMKASKQIGALKKANKELQEGYCYYRKNNQCTCM